MNRPPRLSRRTARRLLDGRPAARAREQRLGYLLEALGERDAPRHTAVPAQLLEAFTRHARDAAGSAASPVGGRGGPARSGARSKSPSRSRRIGRALTVKAAFVLAFSGATVAATAADALPPSAQSAVHELLGAWGVPAPSSASSPSSGAGRTPAAAAADARGLPSAPRDSAASHPAAPAPPVGGRNRPSPHLSPNSHPVTPAADCAPLDGVRKGRGDSGGRPGPGAGPTAGRGCPGGSGVYHSGRAAGGSADAVTGGESAKDAFGGRPPLDLGHRRTHGPRREKSER